MSRLKPSTRAILHTAALKKARMISPERRKLIAKGVRGIRNRYGRKEGKSFYHQAG